MNMFKKHFRIITVIALAVVLLHIALPAMALEATYPNIVGAPTNGPQATDPAYIRQISITSYISYFFFFIVAASGIIAVLTMVFSGLQILMAAGNPGAISDAKERVWGCIVGIVLLMFSFIILQTINPQLLSQTNPGGGFPAGNNLYYISEVAIDSEHPTGIDWKEAPSEVNDTMWDVGSGWTQLFYKCSTNDKKILVWVYNDVDQQMDEVRNGLDPNTKTIILSCGESIILDDATYPIKSFSWEYENPGIYLYVDDNCSGISSYVQEMGQTFLGVPYFGQNQEEDEIGSVRIVSGNVGGVPQRYFFLAKNADGECSAPQFQTDPGSRCVKMSDILSSATGDFFKPSSFYAMLQNPDPIPNPSGDAIRIESQNLEKTLTDQQIGTKWTWGNPNTLLAGGNNFTGVIPDITEEEECRDDNTDCLKSITNLDPQRRHYNTILYSKNDTIGSFACQILRGDAHITGTAAGAESFYNLLRGNKKIYRMDIIPSDNHQ